VICGRIGLEPCVALKMHLDGVPHYLADVGDVDVCGVHPFCEAMPE